MKFIDLFAGIGGFRMGMERAGNQCVGYVEIDKFARQSYEAIYDTEGEWTAHDITQVKDEEWRKFRGRVDVITGGFPCQSFSIAGKRLGFADETKGTLFFEVARAAKEIQPPYLFLENVKGLLNHDKGRTFRTILKTLDELGYDAEWQLCNSKNFGVPQNRERVIIIGHLRGASTREVFFDAGEDRQAISSNEIKDLLVDGAPRKGRRGTVMGADGISSALCSNETPKQIAVKQIGNISDSKSFGGNPQVGRVYSPEGILPTLNTMQGGGREPKILDDQGRLNKKLDMKDISPTLKAQSHGNEPKVVLPVLTPDRLNKRQNGRRFKTNSEPMFTINTVDRHGVAINDGIVPKEEFGRLGRQAAETMNTHGAKDGDIIEPFNYRVHENGIAPTITTRPEGLKTAILPVTNGLRIRKLTPRECWRLQGFPDWAFDKAQEAGVSDSQLYKQAGNSVTVPLMEFIANRLVIEK